MARTKERPTLLLSACMACLRSKLVPIPPAVRTDRNMISPNSPHKLSRGKAAMHKRHDALGQKTTAIQ